MTKEQALQFKSTYISKGAKDFTKPSHFELPDLLEVHLEAVTVVPEDFHKLQGGVLYPRKETTDKFGLAAGVSFNVMSESTRVDPSTNGVVGRSQGFTMGPDGQPVMGDVCEYEFDPVLRAEEDLIRAEIKADPGSRGPSELTKRLKVLEYTKVARSRANTGARSRATLAVLGLQTGFKDLFGSRREEIFLFSRVMLNTKNQLMAQALLNNLAGNTRSLFGPQNAAQLEGPRNVTHSAEPSQVLIEDSMFSPAEPEPTIEMLRMATLQDLLDKYRDSFNPAGVAIAEKAIAEQHHAHIEDCLKSIKTVLGKQGIVLGGGV